MSSRRWQTKAMSFTFRLAALSALALTAAFAAAERPRAREAGIRIGILAPGPLNAITDVAGVEVGHVTLIEGAAVRTGVTAVLPHGGNLYQDKVPAGFAVANGYGKFMGSTQIMELGEIETPILLTNTLSVPEAAAGAIEWTLARPGNEEARSVNAVVGETNDGWLNDIRARRVTKADAVAAIEAAREGPVAEGAVGAGTGTIAFGWKGGIGTSSRRLPAHLGGWTIGVLVQSNYGGALSVDGLRVGEALGRYYLKDELSSASRRLLHPPRRATGTRTARRGERLSGSPERHRFAALPGDGRGDGGSGAQFAVQGGGDGGASGPDRGAAGGGGGAASPGKPKRSTAKSLTVQEIVVVPAIEGDNVS